MKITVLGSGGCMVIPKPLCQCHVCSEARTKGVPYSRGGPSVFLHDINLLVDTPADIINLLNCSDIQNLQYLTFTHLDPDHVEGLRVIEQITLDFRTWRAYPEKQITLLLPEKLVDSIRALQSHYGPIIDFFVQSGFVVIRSMNETMQLGGIEITTLPVERSDQTAYVLVFRQGSTKVVYAPCDLKPFPEHREDVQGPDVLIIQPGIFETGLRQSFHFPADHISRKTLYTFEQTLELAGRIGAKQTVFVHLEEYWNRSYDDYLEIQNRIEGITFAYDGLELNI
jgi:phosphoribosyl 1,2-cyclic phosphate phosphodiesterase